MILAVLIVTDSNACASAQAHFPFRCNDLKLFHASSVLAMDEKQFLALSKCRLKKEHVPGLGADLGRRPDGQERQPDCLTIELFVQKFQLSYGMRGHVEDENRGQKGFPNHFHMLQVYVWDSVMCDLKFGSTSRRIGCQTLLSVFPTDSWLMTWEQSQLLSIMKFPEAWIAREAAKRRQFELRRLAAGYL